MNLYDASQKKNYEIGTVIKDRDAVKEISAKIITGEMIQHWSKEHREGEHYQLLKNGLFLEKDIRYCINCRKPVKYVHKHYHCSECKVKSKTDGVSIFEGKYCHICGQESNKISEKFPLCYKCWSERR